MSGARDRVALSHGEAFSAGEVLSAYDQARIPYQGERLGFDPAVERRIRQRNATTAPSHVEPSDFRPSDVGPSDDEIIASPVIAST